MLIYILCCNKILEARYFIKLFVWLIFLMNGGFQQHSISIVVRTSLGVSNMGKKWQEKQPCAVDGPCFILPLS